MNRIFVIGAGKLGTALGLGWLDAGHDVRFGVRDPSDPRYARLPSERVGPANERHDADVIVLATPFGEARSAISALGNLAGVIIIDGTNPLAMGPDGLHLIVGHDTSGAEQIAALASGARVFKTLNQTGAENITNARSYALRPVMFVAGDDNAGKAVVTQLISDLGLESVDAGPLRAARLLEPLAMMWIELAMKRGRGRNFAFAVMSQPDTATAPAPVPTIL